MKNIEVLGRELHPNGGGEPFVVAVVDDTNDGETKLVVMFETPGRCAVLSLDRIIEEDISARSNSQMGDKYEEKLRELLWGE